jgi:hypothetical protein
VNILPLLSAQDPTPTCVKLAIVTAVACVGALVAGTVEALLGDADGLFEGEVFGEVASSFNL